MHAPSRTSPPRFLPRRAIGQTGFVATVLGIGDVADRAVDLDACVATLRNALDAGLNVVDTAPGYEDGYSEEIVGVALRGRRDGIFLIDKIDFWDRPVRPQIDGSLERLQLGAVDLMVFHNVSTLDDWERIVLRNGPMSQLEEAMKEGQARFRGISSHHPDVLRAAIDSGTCDVLMFPVGPFVDGRYVEEILPLTRARGIGSICFKTFGAGKLLGDTEGYSRPLTQRPRGKRSSGGVEDTTALLPRLTVDECLHYTLTLDPDVALLGMSFANEQEAAFEAASRFRPLSHERLADIRRRAEAAIANKGPVWWNPERPTA